MKYINVVILFFLFSCVAKESSTNKIIEKEKMHNILEEVFVLETYYHLNYGFSSQNKTALDSSVSVVLKNFGVTKTSFESSFIYYSKNLSEFKGMQTEIMERLEKKAN